MSKPKAPAVGLVAGIACAKCDGNANAEGVHEWLGPVYVPEAVTRTADRSDLAVVRYTDTVTPEHLRFQCPHCGYRRTEPCRDAEAHSAD